MKRISVITGTRAEYGLLKPLLTKIRNYEDMILQLVVTGMHLSPEFGLTYQEIEQDGFEITERNEMLLSSDTPNGITKSAGIGMIGFADIFTRIRPDMVVVLGDRFETFAAAVAAMIHRIPIAHIHGGELTEGAIDDPVRHSITKMSALHFVSTEQYKNRVIQLGEHPERVFCVGALGVENIHTLKLRDKEELARSIHFALDTPYVIVTYHPVTFEDNTSREQFLNLLAVFDRFPEYHIVFTKANADTDGRVINQLTDRYVQLHKDRAVAVTSLGSVRYLSAVKYCEMVIGNSSSGIIEAPVFKVPTVNIGERQRGRIKGKSVIDCGCTTEEIAEAVRHAKVLKKDKMLSGSVNPYEGKNTSDIILKQLGIYLAQEHRIQKKFYDIGFV